MGLYRIVYIYALYVHKHTTCFPISCKIYAIIHIPIDGSDYYGIEHFLEFQAGLSAGDSSCVDITIHDDQIKEKNESFVFALCAEGEEDVEIYYRFADVHIIDDDCK